MYRCGIGMSATAKDLKNCFVTVNSLSLLLTEYVEIVCKPCTGHFLNQNKTFPIYKATQSKIV